MNSKDLTIENMKLKVLIYGKSGTGKTSFACSFPRPYVFDFDNGMLSQRGRDVEYDVLKGVAAYNDFELKLNMIENDAKFETLVFDSITTLQEACIDMILEMTRKKVPTQYEWMLLITKMKELFERITKIDKHIIVVAHEMIQQDEITGEISYSPVLYGKKLPSQIPLFFDEVYRAKVGRDDKNRPTYSAITAAGSNYMAKSRLGYLPIDLAFSKDGKMLNGYDVIRNTKEEK